MFIDNWSIGIPYWKPEYKFISGVKNLAATAAKPKVSYDLVAEANIKNLMHNIL